MKIRFLLLLFIFFSSIIDAKSLEKVSLQLQWLDQFQFAGYYIAKEKGFYSKAGLDVDIKKFSHGIIPSEEVINKKSTYAVGRSSLIIEKSNNKPIIILASIFQSSPLVLLTTNKDINTIKDIKNKRIMVTTDAAVTASLYAMMSKHNILSKDFLEQPHSFNINDLINDKTDLMASYLSNEPYRLEKQGIPYKIFDPKDYGFDFYSDILFTSQNELKNHPQRVQKFLNASLEGWRYAFEHIDETVDIILEKYNEQNKTKDELIYEAKELKKLAYYKTNKLGQINAEKLQRIYDVFNVMGLIKNKFDINTIIYSPQNPLLQLNKEEQNYLEKKHAITMCVDPNWYPIEAIENGKHIGLVADFYKIFEQKLNIPFRLVETKNWAQTIEFAKKRKCDILSLAVQTPQREKYLNFTNSFLDISLVLATKHNVSFINSFEQLNGKNIGIMKDYAYNEMIKEKYPNINIIDVDSIENGLQQVVDGELFGVIDTITTIGYLFQTKFYTELKISAKFEEKWKLSAAVRNDDPILYKIMQKIVDSIDTQTKQMIQNKYISVEINEKIDYTLTWYIFIVSLIIGFIFLLRQSELKKYNDKLEVEIENKTKDLKEVYMLAKIGTWEYDILTNELKWSDETYKIFETNKQEYPTLNIKDFLQTIHLEDGHLFFESFDSHLQLKERKPYVHTHKIITLNGNIKFIEQRTQTIFDENNHPIKSIGTIQDITENKELELELLQKDKFLMHQSRFAQMGELLSMIAHQWRQPLSAISMTTTNLKIKIHKDTIDKQYFLHELDLVDSFTQHLSNTINEFRNFFKPDKKIESVNLNKLIENTTHIIKTSLDSKEILLINDSSTDDYIDTYASGIKQVLLNILKNSEDAITDNRREDGLIKINTFKESDNFIIEVSDNAGGIDEETLPKIFDPYFSTKKSKDGTGLGLYMSKLIIEDHCKGSIKVENILDGVKFTITLKSLNKEQR